MCCRRTIRRLVRCGCDCLIEVEVHDVFAGDAMGNLANTYWHLQRHQDALLLQEKTLEFRRRVLPKNHPDIGTTWCDVISLTWHMTIIVAGDSMGNLGSTFMALGRYQDAEAINKKTLEFMRCVLPENHPNIGATSAF